MPSGAKKRKAAKKKKENQDQLNNSSDSAAVHGDEVVKHQIEKEIKIDNELGKNDGTISPNEANKKSCDGDSSRSFTSDDESHEVKKGQANSETITLSNALSIETTLDQNVGATQENGDNGTQHMKDDDLVATSLYPIEKTSWMDCCGLFEVFSSRNEK